MGLFWPIRVDVTIVSIGNNCNFKPDWPESPSGTVVKSNLIGQYHPVNKGNPLYNWVLRATTGYMWHCSTLCMLGNFFKYLVLSKFSKKFIVSTNFFADI